MPEPPEATAPPAPPAPPSPMKAVAFRFSGWVGQMPAASATKKLMILYRLADPAQRKQIEAAVRAAVAQAQRAHAQAKLTLRLAEQTGSSNATTWHAVQFQIVDEDD
jgi:hypothetical protein